MNSADTTGIQDTSCAYPNCDSKVWQGLDGSVSSYCSSKHRDAMAAEADHASTCKNCNRRPAYIENGHRHDYCGRRCANDATTKSSSSASTDGSTGPSLDSTKPKDAAQCGISSCRRSVFVGKNGFASQWCSRAHRTQSLRIDGTEACLLCNQQPKALLTAGLSDYCSRKCGQDALKLAPGILPINNNYTVFEDVKQQFIRQWKHRTPVPGVIKVWRIIGLKPLYDDFANYKLSVEMNRNLPGGNCKRRWHGTVRACRIGDDENQNTICMEQTCSLCRIIETSFRLAKFGKRTNYGRFGQGIYTSATSSKANAYVKQLGQSSHRAMLLSDVVLGNAKKLYVDDSSLKQAPEGFDSVIGEPGHSLNYDEAIVYKNEAIRPLFLVIYQ
ncbi:hypothetical protein BC835DRAFT_308291 [Cytidiella melzeri]|nr:hypothetical protein BC835DRAFT_308291 [Cytidiella melzeri]